VNESPNAVGQQPSTLLELISVYYYYALKIAYGTLGVPFLPTGINVLTIAISLRKMLNLLVHSCGASFCRHSLSRAPRLHGSGLPSFNLLAN
jgi:hypothetical protein